MARIIRPEEVAGHQAAHSMSDAEKLTLIMKMLSEVGGMVNQLASTYYAHQPCAVCGFLGSSPIRCKEHMGISNEDLEQVRESLQAARGTD